MEEALFKLAQSVIGVLFIFILVKWLFPKNEKLTADRVSHNFTRCYPETDINKIILDTEAQSAILLPVSNQETIGAARILGDRSVTKLFSFNDVSTIELKENHFRFDFHDFTMPNLILNVSESDFETLKAFLETSKSIAPKVTVHAN